MQWKTYVLMGRTDGPSDLGINNPHRAESGADVMPGDHVELHFANTEAVAYN